MNNFATVLVCVCTVAGAVSGAAQNRGERSVLDRNLLVNSGAEAEMNGKAVPGWGDPQDGFYAEMYGHTSGEWDWGVSGCAGCGKRYFRLAWEGTPDTQKSATQTVDLSLASEAIDSGSIAAKLEAYLGALRDGDTTVQVAAVWLDAGGKELGRIETAAFDSKALPKAEAGDAALMAMDAGGPVPAGTRRADVRILAKPAGSSGSYIGLADNISLVLTRK